MKVKRGDIVNLDLNRCHFNGYIEHNKKRPYLVVSNDYGNEKSNICIVIPLTSNLKRLAFPTHTIVAYNDSMAICEQIMTVNQNDVVSIVGNLYENQMLLIDACLKIALGVN